MAGDAADVRCDAPALRRDDHPVRATIAVSNRIQWRIVGRRAMSRDFQTICQDSPSILGSGEGLEWLGSSHVDLARLVDHHANSSTDAWLTGTVLVRQVRQRGDRIRSLPASDAWIDWICSRFFDWLDGQAQARRRRRRRRVERRVEIGESKPRPTDPGASARKLQRGPRQGLKRHGKGRSSRFDLRGRIHQGQPDLSSQHGDHVWIVVQRRHDQSDGKVGQHRPLAALCELLPAS